MIDGVAMKGRQIIITTQLQPKVVDQLQSNYMDKEKKTSSVGLPTLVKHEFQHQRCCKNAQHIWNFSQPSPRTRSDLMKY